MTGYLVIRVGTIAFLLIAIAMLEGSCQHPRPKDEENPPYLTDGSQLSPTLVGKRITIRGGLFRFKCGPGIQFADGRVVCLAGITQKAVLDDPYADTYEKLVEATGTLRFYKDSTATIGSRSLEGPHERYYLEKDKTQVRIIADYTNDVSASMARSHLATLVGKQVTVRGKLQFFVLLFCTAVELDDGEIVCLEDPRPQPISNPYSRMLEKQVEATGILRFFHDSKIMDETAPSARVPDHYYFETETAKVRLVSK